MIVFFSLNSVYGFTTSSSNAAGSRLTATVKRGTVLSSVSASGNVAVAQSASTNFATSGTITAVYVFAGEHVHAGQALAKMIGNGRPRHAGIRAKPISRWPRARWRARRAG